MDRLLNRANKRIGWGGAAVLLIFAALSGQVLGFLRTRLVNANFPVTGPHNTDAYFAAFKIPDFFFFTLAAGALGVAFMPFLADHLEKGDKKGVWELSSSLLNLLGILMSVIAVIIVVFAKPLIHYIVAPDLNPVQLSDATNIMRFLALNPLLFTISGVLTAVQQTFGRFFFYAVAPLFYNVTIIVSIYVFKDNIGMVGLGIGALIGAVLQLLVVLFGMSGMEFKYIPTIKWKSADFKRILRQLPPRSIDQGIDSLNSIVETRLARRIGEGYISYYENAYTLHTAPILLIGTAISTAAFPRLAERLAQNRVDLFRRDFLRVVRILFWIAAPVTIISYFSRGYLVRLIFARGKNEIALIFGFLAGAIFFRILYSIASRYFYAQKDTKTPLFVSLFAIVLNIFLAYTLSRPSAYGVTGLAMAQSIVAMTEVMILSIVMALRDHKLFNFEFFAACMRILSVTGFSVIAAFIMVSFLPLERLDQGFILTVKLSAIAGVTITIHCAISWLFGLEEVQPVIDRLSRIKSLIFKPVKVDW